MELIGRDCMKLIVFLHLSISVTFCIQCDARVSKYSLKKASQLSATSSIIKSTNKLEMEQLSDSSNTQPYVSSPFTLPPFESLPPMPLPQNTPPYCENPPTTQQPPSTTSPSTPTVYPTPTSPTSPPPPTQFTYSSPPNLPLETPPPSPPSYTPGTPDYMPNPPSYTPGTPEYVPSPPETVPNTPGYEFSPPESEPGTPGYEPNPPIYYPSPTGGNTPSPSPPTFNPGGPPIFLPPVVYPPPAVPPPPHKNPSYALWCVAKPSVPEPIIQEAMNYACGSGADCGSIQPAGSCFQPDTLFAHASYAFNSYWQRTKVAGGTCDFGGTAILVTVDPSFDGCHFIYY